jgi:hypothetical protein
MLFDLQSRGRRSVVKVIYAGLAVLLGGGLLLFGVGTGVGGGGFLDIFNNQGTSTKSQLSAQEKSANRAVRANPSDAAAWLTLARLRYQDADYDQTTLTFTQAGRVQLQSATQAWRRYLVLKPKQPDPTVARLMVNAYSQAGLDEPSSAADTMEIVTAAQPSAQSFGALAQLAYAAGQIRKGDLASARAVQLTPKARRTLVKQQLATARKTALKQQVQSAVTPSAGATTPSRSTTAPSGSTTTPSG